MNPSSEQAAALAGPAELRKARTQAGKLLDSTPFPSTSSELWRYSRVDELSLERYRLVEDVPETSPDTSILSTLGDTAVLVVTVDGHVVDCQVSDKAVTVSRHDEAVPAVRCVAGPVDLFEIFNASFMTDPVVIDIAAGQIVERPIVVLHLLSGDGVASFPRTVVRAAEASQANVIEIHQSADVDSLVVPVIESQVDQAANLSYLNVQRLGRRVHHVGYNTSRVEKEAMFASLTVALGGDYARVRTDSQLVGIGADSKLRAIYFGTGGQMHDFRTLQAHEAPKSTSDLFFKGAVGDVARSVYSGLIRVDKGASGTNAFQTNRNLVLSSGAHAESVPNLEIEENDVKCSHASAVGPIDEDQRYYLESRGVPEDVANRLITLGFLNEVLENLPSLELRELLVNEMAEKLDAVGKVDAR